MLIAMAGKGDPLLNLSLSDSILIALENNTDIQIQRRSVEASQAEVTTRKGSFDPVLSINSFYAESEVPTSSTFVPDGVVNEKQLGASAKVEGKLPTGTFYNLLTFSTSRVKTDSSIVDLSPSWSNTLGFSLGQNLLRGFGLEVNRALIITAERSSQIAEKELDIIASNVLLDVERHYWLLVAAKKNLELEKKGLELALDLQARNEIRIEVGVLPPIAATQAKSEVAAKEIDLIRAENELSSAEDNFKNILGINLSQRIEVTDEPTTEVYKYDEQSSLDKAYELRPEIGKVKLDIENKKTLKRYYSNQRLPSLTIEGNLELKGLGGDENPKRQSFGNEKSKPIPPQFDSREDAYKQIWDADFATWQVLGKFSFPLFNKTARGEHLKASAELQMAAITLKRTWDNIALEVRSTIRGIESALKAIDAARASVELAEEVLSNEQEKLNVGIGTTREVMEAQRDLIDAGTREIKAITSYNIYLAELKSATGTLLQSNNVEIEEH